MKLELALTLHPTTVHRPEELAARATFTNRGTYSLLFNRLSVSAPSLALILNRVGGEVVPLGPPPVPSDDNTAVHLKLGADESYGIVYEGFLPQPLAPGEYELRLRYVDEETTLQSDPVQFKCV